MTEADHPPLRVDDFFRKLQQFTNRIHATRNVDEIMLDLSAEICALFEADRLTIYALSEDKASLVSKVKTGLASFKQLKLPISAQSIAGYAALSRKVINLRDVYDEDELRYRDEDLRFQQGVDKRTGYRTEQMLAAPILHEGEVLGVVQLINNLRGGRFPDLVVEATRCLCETLAIAFIQRQKTPVIDRSRFVTSIKESVLTRDQIDFALKQAEDGGVDIEDVLLNEYGLKVGVIGRALADYFSVPYLGFHPERRKPAELLKAFNREFVLENQWMPIEESRNGLYVLCTDPEQVKRSGAVARIFPQARPVYCVTTRREFGWMVNQCFVAPPEAETEGETREEPFVSAAALLSPQQQQELASTVSGLVAGAHQQGLSELRIETSPGRDSTEIRFTVSGVLKIG